LKNDFTRTGKRNTRGALNDGINSLTRYYLNNFRDGFRQDSYDLLSGAYVVDSLKPSPFAANDRMRLVGLLLLAALLLLGSYLWPYTLTSQLLFAVLWAVSLWLVWRLVLRSGKRLVDAPCLLPPKK